MNLLEVQDLCVHFPTQHGLARAVDGASFELRAGETLGLVGESGCGKSVTALAILRLLESPPAQVGGRILFRGRDLLELQPHEMRRIRGNEISMVFQEPMSSLNPVFSCGEQVAEALRVHQGLSRAEARRRAVDCLQRVRFPDPEGTAKRYPHELSGGMRQRVMIAMALACQPQILIADEATTALDVTIQAEILALLRELQEQDGMSILLITHDLGVVAETAHRVAVMYAGHVVEACHVRDLFAGPRHPYTRALFESMPRMDADADELPTIAGRVPHPAELPPHCRFEPRCRHRIDRCAHEDPEVRRIGDDHRVRCLVDLDAATTVRQAVRQDPATGGDET